MAEPLVVMITGCSEGGIGYELALAFAQRGCKVFASARRLSAMTGLSERGISLLQLDVTDAASIRSAVAAVVARAGRIDVLVNNAGVVTLGPTAEVPLAVVRAAFEANVFGLLDLCQVNGRRQPVVERMRQQLQDRVACFGEWFDTKHRCLQAVVPHMARQGSGRLINIGSLTGFTPVPLRGIYSATKGAVLRLSDALRVELKPLGVQVMLVAPGFINTHARDTAKDAACSYSNFKISLWGDWLTVLEAAMSKLLVRAVPADVFATQLAAVTLQPTPLPRYWVGPCAGIEWLTRWLPLWLQDRLVAKAMGLQQLEPTLLANVQRLKGE